jgi:hypothetical protein
MFPVYELDENDPERVPETMGAREKYSFRHQELGRCFFKVRRPKTGEDWSEKIAEQICRRLGIPHARYELATCGDEKGVVSPSFLPEQMTLIHGNELLDPFAREDGFVLEKNSPFHTLDNIQRVLQRHQIGPPLDWKTETEAQTAMDVFVGYLLLNCVIGNTDRHYENWAIMECYVKEEISYPIRRLAPTYDHASCLGRELQDDGPKGREERLRTRDAGLRIETYAKKARSALYADQNDPKSKLTTFEAFQEAKRKYPNAAEFWVRRLDDAHLDEAADGLFQRIPPERITAPAIEFAKRIIRFNGKRLRNRRHLEKEGGALQ